MTEFLIGSYTADAGGGSTGIARGSSGPDGFEVGPVEAVTDSPSWLARSGTVIHATLEEAGAVASFELSDTGLEPLSRVDTGGPHPCHLVALPDAVIVSCYGDGVVAVHDRAADGAVGALRQVLPGAGSGPLPAQEGPHAHHVHVLPDGRVLTLDLGADRMHVHAWDDGLLERIDSVALPEGTGPRDLIRLPGGELGILGEWSCELLVLDPVGDAFEIVQILALPDATPGSDQAAALGLSGDRRFLFAGLRGADRVAMMALADDGVRGIGSVSSGGSRPRHLLVDGEFLHVANERSNGIGTFRVRPDGALDPVGVVVVASPTQLLELPRASETESRS